MLALATLALLLILLALFLFTLVVRKKKLTSLALLLLGIVVGFFCPCKWILQDALWSINPPHRQCQILLKPNQRLSSFIQEIEKQKIVPYGSRLSVQLHKLGLDKQLKPGVYSLKAGSSWNVAKQLSEQKPSLVKVTLLPGADPLLPWGEVFSAEEQQKALQNLELWPQAMRGFLPQKPELRSAFLLPETYSLPEKDVNEATKAAAYLWYQTFKNQGNFLGQDQAREVAVLASLVEKEAKLDEERSLIAGVITNRLKLGRLLQIDASVIYAWKKERGESLKRVLYRHLELDSPYNTYLHKGLPPTPIAIPSKASWEAAIHPAQHDYVYYVSDGQGGHKFSRTEAEHQQAVIEYRKKLKP